MADPSGDHDGKLPDSAIFRARPPSDGITQISPPRSGRLALRYMSCDELARVETKAICVPSGEKAGCTSSAELLVRFISAPPEICLRKISKLPVRFET